MDTYFVCSDMFWPCLGFYFFPAGPLATLDLERLSQSAGVVMQTPCIFVICVGVSGDLHTRNQVNEFQGSP